MLLSFRLAIFLDFAKLAAAEESDPDAPGTLKTYYHFLCISTHRLFISDKGNQVMI